MSLSGPPQIAVATGGLGWEFQLDTRLAPQLVLVEARNTCGEPPSGAHGGLSGGWVPHLLLRPADEGIDDSTDEAKDHEYRDRDR